MVSVAVKVVIMEVTRVVMKEHTDITNTTITNMTITITITDMSFMKNGENTVDTKVNITDIMKVDTTVNTDITTDITEVIKVDAIKFLERKKSLLLPVKKLLLKTLQRNGGWLVIIGVVGDILTGDILMRIMMVVAGNGVTLDFTDMEDTVDPVVDMEDMVVDMVVTDTVRVESLIVANLLIQQSPRDVDVILEQLVTVDITFLIMVQDTMTTIMESRDLGPLDTITSAMIGRIGITTIITSNILPTCNIFHMMITMVVVMDGLVYHEVHVASLTSILLFILRLLTLSETVSEMDMEMDSLVELETVSDLEMDMVMDTVTDLETDSVLETDLETDLDLAMDLETDLDLEMVIMVSEVVSTTMVYTVTTDGQYVDLTTTEYVTNVAIFQVEDQDACVKVFDIIHSTCQLSTDLLMCISIATLARTSSLIIDALPELTFRHHKKNPKKLVQPNKESFTRTLTMVHGLPTHGGEIGGVVTVIMLGVKVMVMLVVLVMLVSLEVMLVDMVMELVMVMEVMVDMVWDVQLDSALVVMEPEPICKPTTAKIKLRKLLKKMKKLQQRGFAFQSDTMVDMGSLIFTDIQALVRAFGDGDGHGSKTRFQDQS